MGLVLLARIIVTILTVARVGGAHFPMGLRGRIVYMTFPGALAFVCFRRVCFLGKPK